jgi:hypothetical protein
MEHEEAQCQTQTNQQNIPNNPSTIHHASDEDTRHVSGLSIDSSSSNK